MSLPSITPPAPEMLARLMAEHARRYPRKATVTVIGDGGAPVRLPLLIANPSGSVKPADPRAFPAWSKLIAATLAGRGGQGIGAELVRDCLLWPDRGTLAAWEERWPALLDALDGFDMKTCGAAFSAVLEPGAQEEPPAELAEALESNPAACWRWIDRGTKPLPVLVSPPSQAHWTGFVAAKDKDGADHVALLDEMIMACVKGEGLGALLVEWPGLVLPLYALIVKMAGAGAEARLGEW